MNGDRVRECLREGPVLMPGVWDALSARLTHEAGFPVAFLSGYATAATLLGLPDFGYVTQSEIGELEQIAAATPGLVPVANMIEAGKTPLLTPGELHDLGFDLIVSPLSNLFSAARAMARSLEELQEHGTLRDHLDLLTTFDDFNRVVDLEHHYGLEDRYREDDV